MVSHFSSEYLQITSYMITACYLAIKQMAYFVRYILQPFNHKSKGGMKCIKKNARVH